MTSSADSNLSSLVRFADIPPEFQPNETHPIRVRSRQMPSGWRMNSTDSSVMISLGST